MKRARLIKMDINKVYDGARVGKHFSATFSIKNGYNLEDALLLLLLNFALNYVIRKVRTEEEDFKLNRHTSAIVFVDDVNYALFFASKF